MPLKKISLLGVDEKLVNGGSGLSVASLAVASIFFAAAIWGDFIRFGLGISFNQAFALGFFCVAALMVYLAEGSRGMLAARQGGGLSLIVIAGVFLFLFLFSILRGFEPIHATLAYTPIIGALLLLLDKRAVMLLILLTLVVTLVISLLEVANRSFFFIVVSRYEGLIIDEQLMAGALGAFRSKGLFAGPTSAVAFAIIAFAYAPKNPLIALLCVAISVLSGSKAGLAFVSLMGTIVFISASPRAKLAIGVTAIAAAGTMWMLSHFSLVDAVSLSRSLEFGRVGAQGNEDRFGFWTGAIYLFWEEWTLVEQFFGAPRSLFLDFQLFSESSILDYLLDTGIVGFCAFLVAVWLFLIRPSIRDPYAFASRIALLALCLVVPLITQAGLASLFWFLLWSGSIKRNQHVPQSRFRQISGKRIPAAGP
jgi:hypothetical protein